ncbi:hypothetical protein M8J75_011934 [Diaphorina citri]|nr:hypothetical protein M8J75_011934 [Diaphorina citri]
MTASNIAPAGHIAANAVYVAASSGSNAANFTTQLRFYRTEGDISSLSSQAPPVPSTDRQLQAGDPKKVDYTLYSTVLEENRKLKDRLHELSGGDNSDSAHRESPEEEGTSMYTSFFKRIIYNLFKKLVGLN